MLLVEISQSLGRCFLKEGERVGKCEEQTEFFRLQQRTLSRTSAITSTLPASHTAFSLGLDKGIGQGSLMRTFGNPGRLMICSLNHLSAAQPETVNTVTHLISQERLGRGLRQVLGDYNLSVHLLRTVERGYQRAQTPIHRSSWEGCSCGSS